jgi:hypothetical protein
MTGLNRAFEIIGISMALLALGYLLELAKENRVLLKSLSVALMLLIVAIGFGAILFRY